MSRFLSQKYDGIEPYVSGEQPKDRRYIKLNTNESPYPPSPLAAEAVSRAAVTGLKLYSEPSSKALRQAIARFWGLDESEVVVTNGSDEALALAFFAYCGGGEEMVSLDITYNFYPVLSGLLGSPYRTIPLKEDFTVDVDALCAADSHIVIANPNAPTGIALPLEEMERIIQSNPSRVVIVDEAYADFWGYSCIPLIKKYPNLMVVQTFSKSRALAGARLGFAAGQKELIEDLDKIRDSLNPYNVNTLSQLLGIAAMKDECYLRFCVQRIVDTRERVAKELKALGFEVLPSSTNFLLAKHPQIGGERLYLELKSEGILVRYFSVERIRDYIRVSIGSDKEMDTFMEKIRKILQGANQ
ncbi:MAG: histidinol-phosphate transaminase [Clostridiales bacterium]|jgi:histidinol-phosphate aminotransferase|nr:histidinol-phosphate transaminase [Clostridiales bacterium]HOB64657.1 histidinol-phosphate transaminase [Clostridia bacterium]HOK82362.1 histidinol-phosphate transaminase [Clostridia bacterium]HOL61480.1 histidinol-phosphate transaminase [Clostridia bacterium]HPO54106.1 histidinol-phosphate transaminase [Clostridia bacterium]